MRTTQYEINAGLDWLIDGDRALAETPMQDAIRHSQSPTERAKALAGMSLVELFSGNKSDALIYARQSMLYPPKDHTPGEEPDLRLCTPTPTDIGHAALLLSYASLGKKAYAAAILSMHATAYTKITEEIEMLTASFSGQKRCDAALTDLKRHKIMPSEESAILFTAAAYAQGIVAKTVRTRDLSPSREILYDFAAHQEEFDETTQKAILLFLNMTLDNEGPLYDANIDASVLISQFSQDTKDWRIAKTAATFADLSGKHDEAAQLFYKALANYPTIDGFLEQEDITREDLAISAVNSALHSKPVLTATISAWMENDKEFQPPRLSEHARSYIKAYFFQTLRGDGEIINAEIREWNAVRTSPRPEHRKTARESLAEHLVSKKDYEPLVEIIQEHYSDPKYGNSRYARAFGKMVENARAGTNPWYKFTKQLDAATVKGMLSLRNNPKDFIRP